MPQHKKVCFSKRWQDEQLNIICQNVPSLETVATGPAEGHSGFGYCSLQDRCRVLEMRKNSYIRLRVLPETAGTSAEKQQQTRALKLAGCHSNGQCGLLGMLLLSFHRKHSQGAGKRRRKEEFCHWGRQVPGLPQ